MSILMILFIAAMLLCGLMLGWGLYLFMESYRLARAEKHYLDKGWDSELSKSQEKICGVPARKQFFSSTMFKNGKRVEYISKKGAKR